VQISDISEMCDLIRAGKVVSSSAIIGFVDLVAARNLPIELVEEWLRAVYAYGLDETAKVVLTEAMMNTGVILKWDDEDFSPRLVVDKHSTGGVGDKMSLMLAPALAACGLYVPMLAGRGLGHTGGTIDKLESIEGFSTDIEPNRMQEIVREIGCCIAAQNESIAPADGLLYAVRDVTGTVASIPLITASIISKKVAEGISSLVLDVKTGEAAFMQDEEEARDLAKSMVAVAKGLGVKTVAQVTRMDNPIGRMAGNSLEVIESIEVLQGGGPKDTVDLVTLQGAQLLLMAGQVNNIKDGSMMIIKSLQDGSALAKFKAMCIAQGVAESIADELCINPRRNLPIADYCTDFLAESNGFVESISALKCAHVVGELGAGRKVFGESIDHAVGLEFHVDIGQEISVGNKWLTVHHNTPLTTKLSVRLDSAISISSSPVTTLSRLLTVIE